MSAGFAEGSGEGIFAQSVQPFLYLQAIHHIGNSVLSQKLHFTVSKKEATFILYILLLLPLVESSYLIHDRDQMSTTSPPLLLYTRISGHVISKHVFRCLLDRAITKAQNSAFALRLGKKQRWMGLTAGVGGRKAQGTERCMGFNV